MAVRGIATEAETEASTRTGDARVLEVRPPVHIDKGVGVRNLLADADLDVAHAMYAGDRHDRFDAFRALAELAAEGQLQTVVRVGVRSDEGPAEIEHRPTCW